MSQLLILTGLGLFSMFAEMFNFRKSIYPVVLLGLAALLGSCFMDWNTNATQFYGLRLDHMINMDHYSLAFTGVIGATALLWFLMSKSYFEDETNMSDHFSLVLFALVGAVCLTCYTNMAMLFIGVEILSIPLYVLVGSRKRDLASNEAAFKYFLMGSFASAFLLFGIAFIYGATGSFEISKIAEFVQRGEFSPIFTVGLLLILIAMSFKVSAAPFHFWAPDVYQGAPTVITAFMATIVKTAAIAAFFRLFSMSFAGAESKYVDAVWAIAALTMVVGNVIAAAQVNVKRMLAFSSIGHAGFMVVAILVLKDADNAVLYYSAAYSVTSIAAFAVLYLVGSANEGNTGISAFNGLVKRNPLMAGTMTIALLSMAGIPPLAGFFAKYFIFVNAIKSGFYGLTTIAILSSLVGVYYYFKIIIAMFFGNPEGQPKYNLSNMHKFLLLITSVLILFVGVFSDFIYKLLA
jgi:NADH-quinone oxidoreductase subunit N